MLIFFRNVMTGLWSFVLLFPIWSSLVQSLNDDQIKDYLYRYLDKVEQHTSQPIYIYPREPWLAKYTNGKILAPGQDQTLREVLEVNMAARAAANLTFGSPCNLTTEAELGYAQPSQLLVFQQRVATRGQQGFQFCNFIDQYLLCHLNTTSHKQSCDCVPHMTWNTSSGSCVFREGELCRNVETEPKFRSFNWAAIETAYEFETSVISSDCEHGLVCTEEAGTCSTQVTESSLLSIKEILDVVAKPCQDESGNQDFDCAEGSGLAKLVRQFTAEMTKPNSYHLIEILSLEILGAKLLLGHGQTCNQNLDARFESHLGRNGPESNTNWYYNNDPIRKKYLRDLIQGQGPVCDHFRLLTCRNHKCVCRPDMLYDPPSQKCMLKNGVICSPNFQTKEFSFQLSASNLENTFESIQLYRTEPVPCYEQCIELEPGFRVCTQAQDPPAFHSELEQRMTLHLDQQCNGSAEQEVFQDRSHLPRATALSLFQRDLDRVRNHVTNVSFCHVQQHAFCVLGTCTCILPFVRENDRCVASLHARCGDGSVKSVPAGLQDVIQLAINVHQRDHLEILCAAELSCKEASPWDKVKFCSCFNGQFGQNCNAPPSKHLLFLGESGLSKEMLSSEGQKALAEAHESLGDLDGLMVLRSGQKCNQDHHDRLEDLLMSLRSIESVGCVESPFCSPKYFRNLGREARSLSLKGPEFCDRLKDFICFDGLCQCPHLGFEDGGQCHLDLGSNCRDREDGSRWGPWVRCRPGTICVNDFCQLKESSIQKHWFGDKRNGLPYIMEIELYYTQLHQAQLETLRLERRIEDRYPCNWVNEEKLLNYMNNIDPLLEKQNWGGELELKLKRIRIFQHFEKVAADLRSAAPFCNPASNCDADSSECTPYDAPDARAFAEDNENSTGKKIKLNSLLVYILPMITMRLLHRILRPILS